MAKKAVSPFGLLPLYNLFSAIAWGYVLYNVVSIYSKIGQPAFFYETKQKVTLVQCAALIEIFNSAVGIVRSPLLTTVAQVASRLIVVVGIFQCLPETPATHSLLYISLLSAWSVTELVRYLFYFYSLSAKEGPSNILILLRYNLFWILYPIGVASELLIIYSALPFAEANISVYYKRFLIGCMVAYIPGFPMLFNHMMIQRKKIMKSLRAGTFRKRD